MIAPSWSYVAAGLLAAAMTAGCTKSNPAYCDEDKLCADPTRSYCDLAGDFGLRALPPT